MIVFSTRHEVSCPFCGMTATKIYSCYKQSFQHLPI